MSRFLFLLLLLFLIPSACASNVTFSDFEIGRDTDLLVYEVSTSPSLVCECNSTSTVELTDGSDYVIVLKPGVQYWYENPMNAFELMQIEAPRLLSLLVYLLVIAGIGKIIFRW